MKARSKTKVEVESVNLKVDWDSVAENAGIQSMIEMEESVASPMKTDLSSSHGKEVAFSPDHLTKSNANGSHAKSCPEKYVKEERAQSVPTPVPLSDITDDVEQMHFIKEFSSLVSDSKNLILSPSTSDVEVEKESLRSSTVDGSLDQKPAVTKKSSAEIGMHVACRLMHDDLDSEESCLNLPSQSSELEWSNQESEDDETLEPESCSNSRVIKGTDPSPDGGPVCPSIFQLERFYRWCNHGLSPEKALEKAKQSELVPPTDGTHPNCKLDLEELNDIAMLIPISKFRCKFVVETLFMGKDLEEQLEQGLKLSKLQRHPNCTHSWEDVKKMSIKLQRSSLRWKYVVGVYYKGMAPEDVMNFFSILSGCEFFTMTFTQLKEYFNWPAVGPSSNDALVKAKEPRDVVHAEDPHPECKLLLEQITEKSSLVLDRKKLLKDLLSVQCEVRRCSVTSSLQQMADPVDHKEVNRSTPELPNGLPLSSQHSDNQQHLNLSLNQLKKYYKWCISGLSSNEALSKAKKPGLTPQAEDPHPDCKLPFEEIKQISSLIPAKYPRSKFTVETYFGGKDPEKTLKLMMASANIERHPDCNHTWEDLQKMSNELLKISARYKFLVETFYRGKKPEELLKTMLLESSQPASFSDSTPTPSSTCSASKANNLVDGQSLSQKDESVPESEISKLSLNQLKKFYKWCILGVDPIVAIVKAKEPGLIPQTENPHPKCKLPFEEIKQMSLLLPVKHPRALFQVETFFGGKDPEEQLKLKMAKCNMKQHPNCKHSWEELKKIADALPKLSFRLKFVVDSFYGGKSPEELLKSLLSADPHPIASAGDIHFVDGTVKKAVCFSDTEEVSSSSGTPYSHTDLNEPKGSDRKRSIQHNAVRKPDDVVQPDGSDEISSEEALLNNGPDEHFLLIDKTFFGNKELKIYYLWCNYGCDHETAVLKVCTGDHVVEHTTHPNCSYTFHQLRKMSLALQSHSGYPNFLWDRFVIHTQYGGKDPQNTLRYFMERVKTLREPHNIPAEKPQKINNMLVPFEPVAKGMRSFPYAIIPLDSPDHPSNELNFNQLKNYYLWINDGCSHAEALANAKTPRLTPKKMSSQCLVPMGELMKMAHKLPTEKLRNIFIIETYYAGNDPEEVMEYLLLKPTNDRILQQSSPEKQPLDQGENKSKEAEVQFGNYTSTISNEEEFLLKLSNGELKYYYFWRSEGLDLEQALTNVKKRIPLPGTHHPHPNCMYSMLELERMSKGLDESVNKQRFIIHTFFGGKDPGCFVKHLTGGHFSVTGGQAHQAESLKWDITEFGPPTLPHCHPPGQSASHQPHQQPAVGQPQVAMSHPVDQQPPAVSESVMNSVKCSSETPVAMVYPHDQYSTVNTMGYPLYPQLIPGPQNVACSPNPQGSAPILIHPPQATEAYLGYPHAACSPSTYPTVLPQPTVQQQPSPSLQQPPFLQQQSSLSSGSSPTIPIGQLPNAGEPSVRIHDPKQSSLKRKPTDEFPIKITLNASSDQPKPPNQLKEESSPATDKSVPMFIVSMSYPSQSLSNSEMDAIESNLLEAILEMDGNGIKPSFKDVCRSNGRYGITCVDQFSVNWLQKYLKMYQPWPGASLKLILNQPPQIRANAVLPLCEGDEENKILKFIGRQNRGLKVDLWTVMKRWENGDLNTCMDLVIDEDSAAVLKKCSTISFKLGSAEISTSQNDTQSTWSSSPCQGLNTTIRLPPETLHLRSSPPPKSTHSGDGFSSSPQRLGITSSASSLRVETSECTSLSQDFPGRSNLKDHSPKNESSVQDVSPIKQENSWVDWFYSKRVPSRSPIWDRSPSTETNHETHRSRRERKWFDSKSPSPEYSSRPRHHSSYQDEWKSSSKKRRRVSTSPSSTSSDERTGQCS